MTRFLFLFACGTLCTASAEAVVYTPVRGYVDFTTFTVSCPSQIDGCYTCVNDENTTADHRLVIALGASLPNTMTTGLAEGVVRPFIEVDGVQLNASLFPCGSFLRSGIFWRDLPFAPNCPDTAKGVIYRIGDMPQVEVAGDGSTFLDIPAADAQEIPFSISLCSEFVFWGAGCEISGSSQYGWQLHTPAVPDAFQAAAGDAPPIGLPSSEVAFDLASGPGGIVSVARASTDPPETLPIEHLNGYWDVHTDMAEGSYSASIAFTIDPAALPADVEVSGVTVAAWDPAAQTWEPLMTTVDTQAMTATVVTDRMGKFVLLDAPPVPVQTQTWGRVKTRYR